MRLKDYIQSNKRGKGANRLEREAMSDPFLQEALEGFDAVAGDHATIIDRLEKRFSSPAAALPTKRRLYGYWSAAASILLLIGFGAYFFVERTEHTMPVIAMEQFNDCEQAIPADASEPQMEPMEESQQEMTSSGALPKNVPAPGSALIAIESDELLEISVADAIAAEETVSDRLPESAAKQGIQAQEKEIIRERTVDATGKNDAVQPAFGEKEFQTYCQQKADATVCAGKSLSVEVTFFIDETGKPCPVEWINYSCEEAKKEIENLLAASPLWTQTNREVTMAIKW